MTSGVGGITRAYGGLPAWVLAGCLVLAPASATLAQSADPPKPGAEAPAAPGQEAPRKDAPVDPLDARREQSAQNNVLKDEITPELTQGVTQGLAWLAKQQNADGSFGDGRFGRSVAITALACLAFMSDGNVPGRGMYGDIISKGLEYVLANCAESGLIAADAATGPMYGHGFATLFLGEVYGMTPGGDDSALANRTHSALLKACRLIETTQNTQGGWRYNPVPYDADVSVTICQIMALRSARNAGIEVPKETIDRAVEYVRRCQNPDGGFKYQLESGGSAWPRSAAGVATFYYAGIYRDQAIERGVGYLFKSATPGEEEENRAHYYYGHYYAVQAMYLTGGEAWSRWWPAIRRELLAGQNNNGSWSDPSVGDVYGTSMALIILQMPKRYLPIFQK